MTRVTVWVDGDRHGIHAEGHAGDIEACNYITGVLYSLAGFTTNEVKQGRAKLLKKMLLSPGEVIIDAAGEERLEAAFEMAVVGLLQLQATRPEAIRVEIRS